MSDDVLRENTAKWYVIHTYSGHENKVKANMEAMVQTDTWKM